MGQQIWSRFKRGRDDQLWYFTELSKVYEETGSNRLTEELKRVIDELDQLSGRRVIELACKQGAWPKRALPARVQLT